MLLKYMQQYRKKGLSTPKAKVKVCQDILFAKLIESELIENITLKGGTVMYQLTSDRTPTSDLDIDVIRIALNLASLDDFIHKLNNSNAFKKIKLEIDKHAKIEEIKDADYFGFKFFVLFKDYSETYKLKIDIGVHDHVDIIQNKITFDILNNSKQINIKVNPIEQMIVEKTTSIIRHRLANDRMKDIFDIYWLITNRSIDINKLKECVYFIILETKRCENIEEYKRILIDYYKNKQVLINLKKAKNWVNVPEKEILVSLVSFFQINLQLKEQENE